MHTSRDMHIHVHVCIYIYLYMCTRGILNICSFREEAFELSVPKGHADNVCKDKKPGGLEVGKTK